VYASNDAGLANVGERPVGAQEGFEPPTPSLRISRTRHCIELHGNAETYKLQVNQVVAYFKALHGLAPLPPVALYKLYINAGSSL
jgi:hypothetical protein